jgi:hypothetical protein
MARRRGVLVSSVAVAASLCALGLEGAGAESSLQQGVSDRLELQVPRDAHVRILGPTFAPGFPRAALVARAGDVNGDGKPDLLVANLQGHGGDQAHSFLLFGGSWPKTVRLPTAKSRGFRIPGVVAEPAGDVNGDGRDDLLSCGNPVRIMFGRAGTQAASVGAGFTVAGGACNGPAGAGDLDKDGRDDLLFVTFTRTRMFASVVFGRRPRASVRLDRIGGQGFRIDASRRALQAVAPAGDLNGDSRADLVLHTSSASGQRLHIVFGRRRSGTLDLDARSARTLPIIVGLHRFLGDFGAAGDVNGDGVGDLIIAERGRGRACVLFGRRGAWPRETSCGTKRGFTITAPSVRSDLGYTVGAAGDLNGDGLGDLLVSATGEAAEDPDEFGGGALYLVFGRRETTPVALDRDDGVVRIAGQSILGDDIGFSAAAPGDVAGDARPDLAIGARLSGDTWLISLPAP